MEVSSFIIGTVIVIGLFFLLRWLIPSKCKVGEKVVAGKPDYLQKDQYRVGLETVPEGPKRRQARAEKGRIPSLTEGFRRFAPTSLPAWQF